MATRKPNPDALSALQTNRPRIAKAPKEHPVESAARRTVEANAPAPTPPTAPEQKVVQRRVERERATIYLEGGEGDRVRGAYKGSGAVAEQTYSDFLKTAVMQYVEQLEADMNGGQPFKPLPKGILPRGTRV